MSPGEVRSLMSQFLNGDLDPARFDHRAHVLVAHALLSEKGFLEAAIK